LNKSFFVGIGAQKAGTTWLGEYLLTHPQVGFSPLKELHFFDKELHFFDTAFATPPPGWWDDYYAAEFRQYAASLTSPPSQEEIKYLTGLTLRLEMKWDRRRYVDYFELLAEDQHRALGEISPSYALLNSDGFANIRQTMPGAKFVFVLRDPVDRYWSQVRFRQTRLGCQKFDARAKSLSALSDPHFYLCSDYSRTLEQLLSVVPAQDVCVLFYETMIEPSTSNAEVRRLTDFLELDPWPCDPERRVLVSVSAEMPQDAAAEALARFAHIYDDIERRFGSRLPRQWQERMATLSRVA
jgi:hypothetical protein